MKENKIYIESLVHKFFEGKTSNKEEKELWQYFSGEDIPCELEEYKDLFRYFGGEFIEELKEEKKPSQGITGRKKLRIKIGFIAFTTVAAVLLFLIIIPQINKFDPYEGSYMVIDGKKNYDTGLIKQQETEIRKMAAEREREYRQIYEQSEIKTNEIRDILMVKNK